MEEIPLFVQAIFVFGIPGIFIIVYGLRLLNGKRKDMYFFDIHLSRIYAGIPVGLMFLCVVVAAIPQFRDFSSNFFYIVIGFGIIALIFSIIQPSFLKPKWLKWMEHEHKDIFSILKEEAKQMGLRAWDKRVQTQEALEEWVAEVRRKRNL